MWKLLRDKYHLVTKRSTIMLLLKELDSHGVALRKRHKLQRRIYISKGPDFIWHLDGYKLSQFGFCVHGCIDGFSRRMMWLKVGKSNHDPAVILHYYLQCVSECGGCPSVVRMDCGTENSLVAAVQYAFREQHYDYFAGERSFQYGTSPSNIQIECLWSQLRKHTSGWWINVFKEMEAQGMYSGINEIHRMCLAVVFLPLIGEFMHYWNTHCIRQSNGNCIGGIPDDIHDMPQHYGTQSYIMPVAADVWYTAMTESARPPPAHFDYHFFSECYSLVLENYDLDIHQDVDIDNCIDIYLYLVNNIDA